MDSIRAYNSKDEIMKKSNFDNFIVRQVSDFLQKYMNENHVDTLTADECASLLAENNVLSNKIPPKPGFNFRQMLRDGRDELINLVDGAYQERPNTKWFINRKDNL
jgi:hypothetical protein